jgi:hypothetical protein
MVAAWPEPAFTAARSRLYVEVLSDLPPGAVAAAVEELLRSARPG